ncbi:unnamed protein product [Mytilus coruscus]|uniref:Uncharacterized protein n=1 Tax=Mytilus coruscus TaxID=42192 RepID=A0A6J8DD37_MYTCO|nr:unnamed protein product [Mytilus coruscus]
MLNEDMKEKTKIIERLHKAEIRNIELENTIKTLQTRIEQLPMQSSTSYDKPSHVHSYNNEGDDELIIGMRKRVTKFVLGRIDNELNKLESNFNNTWSESQNSQTKANMYQQNIVETPNYSHNHWNYNHAHSQQHWNYNQTHPQHHGEIQSQNSAHENWYEHDNTPFRNSESGQNICTDNLIEIQPLGQPAEPNPKSEISMQYM